MAKTYELRERTDNARDEVDTLGRRLDDFAPPEGGILPSSWDLIEIQPAVNAQTGAAVVIDGAALTVESKLGTYHGDLGRRFAEGFLYNLGGMTIEQEAAFNTESMAAIEKAKADLEILVENLKTGGPHE